MIEKSVSNFSFPLGFVSKIELNFHYKKMTDKMSDNLREKYKISVFQILHLCKVFNNFGFSLTIRGKMLLISFKKQKKLLICDISS